MDKTVIEINGVKLQVDLRYATKIEEFKVGDKVKILVKGYGDTFNSHLGVIAGFDAFKERPTIIVAYIESGYNCALKFAYINQDTKGIEIAPAHDFDLSYEKSDIIDSFDREADKLREQIKDIERKKCYFIEKFGRHFEK